MNGVAMLLWMAHFKVYILNTIILILNFDIVYAIFPRNVRYLGIILYKRVNRKLTSEPPPPLPPIEYITIIIKY